MIALSLYVLEHYCVYVQPLSVAKCPNGTEFTSNIAVQAEVDLELNVTGWMRFMATSNPAIPARRYAYYTGYMEGLLFQRNIFDHHANIKAWFLWDYLVGYSDWPEELVSFYKQNLAWTRSNIGKLAKDRFWREVGNTMAHFDGMVLGYYQSAPKDQQMSEIELFIYVSSGDLLDVVAFALPDMRPDWSNPTPEMEDKWATMLDHCSGLVRLTDTEIYVSQTAWFFYGSMTRVWKEYTFNYSTSVAHKISFSSYPGFSYSFDDFYTTDSGLMYFETTNNIYDSRLYDLCTPKSLMTWIRSQVAGRAAKDAHDFVQLIRRFNSGTYNNYWVVVDLYRFEHYGPRDMVWVLEQIPGRTAAYDVTEYVIYRGYFPSYNIPSMETIRIVSGYPAYEKLNSSKSYQNCARSKIFMRDAPAVQNLDQMEFLMRYNDYLHDPFAVDDNGNREPGNAVASRYDLRTGDRRLCFGGFDTKIGAYNRRTQQYRVAAVSSPTNQTESVPLWKFPPADELFCPRQGLPDGPFNYPTQYFAQTVNWDHTYPPPYH